MPLDIREYNVLFAVAQRSTQIANDSCCKLRVVTGIFPCLFSVKEDKKEVLFIQKILFKTLRSSDVFRQDFFA